MNPATDRRIRRAASRSPARLGVALLLSLLLHGLLLSLQFGLPGLGLPGLELPWNDRRGQATELTVRLTHVEPAPAVPAPPPPKAKKRPPHPTASARIPVHKPAFLPPPPLPRMEAPPLPELAPPAFTIAAPVPSIAPIEKVPPQQAVAAPNPAPARPRPKQHPAVIAQAEPRTDTFAVPPPAPGEQTMQPAETPAPDMPPIRSEQSEPESITPTKPEESTPAIDAAAEQAKLQKAEQEAQQKLIRQQQALEQQAQQRAAEEEARRQADALALQQQQEAEQKAEQEKLAQAAKAEKDAAAKKREEDVMRENAKRLAMEQEREAAQKREQEAAARRAQEIEALKLEEQNRQQEEQAAQRALELEAQKQAEAAEHERAAALARQQQGEALARQQQAEVLAAHQRSQELESQRAAAQQHDIDRMLNENRPSAEPSMQGGNAGVGGSISGNTGSLTARALEQAKNSGASHAPPSTVMQDTPRRRSIFGSIDNDVGLRAYVESWRQKVERNGNLNYAQSSKDRARGDPVVTVAVRSDGSIESIAFNRTSGRPELDEAVRRILTLYAPFGAFPPALARRYDVIEIRRVWSFDDRLRILEEVR